MRILIIDDETNVRRMMRLTLETAGYDVGEAADGEKGLELFGDGRQWDAVLLDQKMPGIDGLETLRRIKEGTPAARVIMVTAYATIELAVDAMKLGAIDFIRKPMTPDTVRGAVAAALARRAPKALPAPPRAAPEIVALTMNGFQIVRVPGDKDSAEHRFKVQRFADRSEHEVAVAVEPEAVSRVARLSRKNLPAGGSFWKLQAERTLARHLWNEGQLPEGGRLTLSDISRDDLDVAAIWEGD